MDKILFYFKKARSMPLDELAAKIANKILEIMDEQYPSEIQEKGAINTLYTIIRSIKETETIPSNVHLKDHARMLMDATANYNLEIIYLLQDLDKELKKNKRQR